MKTKITSNMRKLSLVVLIIISTCFMQKTNAQQTGLSLDESVTNYGSNNINNISIYPRPTRNILIMEAEVTISSNIDMRVMNILGTTLIERTETALVGYFEYKFDLSQFADGMYLLEIRSANQVITTRIIKD
jgi:hypothetical protein